MRRDVLALLLLLVFNSLFLARLKAREDQKSGEGPHETLGQVQKNPGLGPFLYIYDLPKRFNKGILAEDPLLWRTAGQYATGAEIHGSLRCDFSVRTLDPGAASLFFVPVFPELLLLKLKSEGASEEAASAAAAKLVREAVELVQTRWPFWSRSNGSDHFLILSGDHGRCASAPNPPRLLLEDVASSAFALLLGTSSSRSSIAMSSERTKDPSNQQSALPTCFHPGHDLLIPALLPEPASIIPPLGTSREFVLVGPASPPRRSMPRVDESTGATVLRLPNSEGQALMDMWKVSDPPGWVLLQQHAFLGSMHRSLFCACLSTAPRFLSTLSRAILSGCIPVITVPTGVFPHVADLPWSGQLDYSKFSIRLPWDQISDLPFILQATLHNKTELRMLQAELAQVQSLFSYSVESADEPNEEPGHADLRPEHPSALYQLLHELRLRAFALQQSLTLSALPDSAVPESAHQNVPPSCISKMRQNPRFGSVHGDRIARGGATASAAAVSSAAEKPLDDSGAKLRLCTPRISPFVAGTFHNEGKMARLTAFEVEVLHNVVPGKLKERKEGSHVVQALMAAESVASMEKARKMGWGPGIMVDFEKEMPIELRCRFWRGLATADRTDSQPLFESDAVWAPMSEFFLLLHCPLPAGAAHILYTVPAFQLELVARDAENSALHMDPLPVCRFSSLTPVARRAAKVEDSGRGSEGGGARAGGGSGGGDTAICLRPYHDHGFFVDSPRISSHSFDRFLEFLHFHLLLGVDKLYFYDRYGEDKLPRLKPYVDQGMVEHLPFPFWSEAFYRKEAFSRSLHPRAFPLAYDQILSMQHCLMVGRRNSDEWLFLIDSDEFLRYPEAKPGGLRSVLARFEDSHRTGKALASLRVHRYNFLGSEGEAKSAIRHGTQRCKTLAMHKWWPGKSGGTSHDKVAVKPHLIVHGFVQIHYAMNLVKEEEIVVNEADLVINHYSSRVGDKLCRMEDDISADDPTRIEDTSLVWAANLLEKCTSPETCSQEFGCGRLCALLQES